jgi:Flp pilus assembly protein TadG
MVGIRRQPSWRGERGQALIETAIMLPILLLVSVSIFEFGRAYQTWQVLTNAAREGARVAVLPDSTASDVDARVRTYLASGQLQSSPDMVGVTIDRNVDMSIGAATAKASVVTVNYPFSFMVLNPVANLVVNGSTLGTPITIAASAQMRNEAE